MPTEIKCQVCGKVFIGRVGSKYCGKECYRKASAQKMKQANSTFFDRCLESAMASVAACDEDTIDRLTSIFVANYRRSDSKMKKRLVQGGPSLKGRTCEVCGKTYDAKSASQKYCSQKCYKSANRRKQLTATDRYTEVAKIAVGGLMDETRTRLLAMLEGVA